MVEPSGELPDNVAELKALTLAHVACANLCEADAEAARSEVLRLTAEVDDLTQSNAMAKAEQFAGPGDHIVVVAGIPFAQAGTTNNLRVVSV